MGVVFALFLCKQRISARRLRQGGALIVSKLRLEVSEKLLASLAELISVYARQQPFGNCERHYLESNYGHGTIEHLNGELFIDPHEVSAIKVQVIAVYYEGAPFGFPIFNVQLGVSQISPASSGLDDLPDLLRRRSILDLYERSSGEEMPDVVEVHRRRFILKVGPDRLQSLVDKINHTTEVVGGLFNS